MKKWLWYVLGLATAVLVSVRVGDFLSGLIMTMRPQQSLVIAGVALTPEQQMVLLLVVGCAIGLSVVITAFAIIIYGYKALNWQFNPQLQAPQVAVLMLALSGAAIGYGALAQPYTAYGLKPWEWLLQGDWWWVLALILVPSVFLLINLIWSLFYMWPDPVQVAIHEQTGSIQKLERRVQITLDDMPKLAERIDRLHGFGDQLGKLTSDMHAVPGVVNTTLMQLGYGLDNGVWTPSGTTLGYKVETLLKGLGFTYDAPNKQWLKPKTSIPEQLTDLTAVLSSMSETQKAILAKLSEKPHVVDAQAPKDAKAA